jgi:RNA polymerase sigma-32 factor
MQMFYDGTSIARMRKEACGAPILDAADELELLRRVQESNDAVALGRLLESHFRLVVSLAARFARAGISDAELVAEGNLGLVEAARRFDMTKNVRFATYAVWWIRARIGRFVLANRRIVAAPSTRNARKLLSSMRDAQRRLAQHGAEASREAIAEETGTKEEDVAMVQAALSARDVPLGPFDDGSLELAGEDSSPEDLLAAREEEERRARAVSLALTSLDWREREVVCRRLLDEGEGETLASIGEGLGLSRERVRQIETRAKQKLYAALTSLAA